MSKNYREWHLRKSIINNSKSRPRYSAREIWICSLGSNVGDEEDGSGAAFYRPVIIIRGFSKNICWVVPLTKNINEHKYKYIFSFKDGVMSGALISQMKLLDTMRLHKRYGYVNKKDFENIKQKIRQLLV